MPLGIIDINIDPVLVHFGTLSIHWYGLMYVVGLIAGMAVAVPFATRQLADLGARVIKVERPGSGDFARGYDTTVRGQASYFVWLNRGKESIELDIKSATAGRCSPPSSPAPTC